jgi:RimJ/RimL family protein N-acetyltransferase
MEVRIETERLLIRPLELADAPGMFIMDSDPEVHKYVGGKPMQTVEEIEAVIAYVRQQYLDNGIGRWAVIEKGSNEFVGWTGFKLMKETVKGYINYYDFGYRLARRFWGKGYATESGAAALRYGIDKLQYKDIYAMTDVDNNASRHVLEKLGFSYTGDFPYDGEPLWRAAEQPTTWYELHI